MDRGTRAEVELDKLPDQRPRAPRRARPASGVGPATSRSRAVAASRSSLIANQARDQLDAARRRVAGRFWMAGARPAAPRRRPRRSPRWLAARATVGSCRRLRSPEPPSARSCLVRCRHRLHAARAGAAVRADQAAGTMVSPRLETALHGTLRVGLGAHHEVSHQRLVVALDHEGWLRLHEQTTHLVPGIAADAQLADRRALLHARC